MALFGMSNTPESDTPAPLSQERLIAVFKREGWHFQVDGDGDMGAVWEDQIFWFVVTGPEKEILQIVAPLHARIEAPRESVRDFIDEWHAGRFWPKACTRLNDDGTVAIMSEVNIDWEKGVTDDQLAQQVKCAIGTTLGMYEQLKESFTVVPFE
ncbi:MAG: YbjN domain-containing protein [Actinomycetaceae bacterium]|nr:YbjN domain-containing protein [Actinomycetaceae bacterium]